LKSFIVISLEEEEEEAEDLRAGENFSIVGLGVVLKMTSHWPSIARLQSSTLGMNILFDSPAF